MTSMVGHGARSAVHQSGVIHKAKDTLGDLLDDGQINNSNKGKSGAAQIQSICGNRMLVCAVLLMLVLGACVPAYIAYTKPHLKEPAMKAVCWCLFFFPYGWYLTYKVAMKAYM